MMHQTLRVAAITATCGFSASALAQNEWTDAMGGLYSDAANWSAGVPTESDDLFFNLVAPYTVTLQQDRVANSILIGKSDVTFDLGGNTLTLAGQDALGSTGEFEFPLFPALRITNGDLRTPSADFDSVVFRFLAIEVGQGGRLLLDTDFSPIQANIFLTGDDAYMRAGNTRFDGGEARLEMSNGAAAELQSLRAENSSTVLLNGQFTSLRVAGGASFGPQSATHRIENGATLEAGSLSVFGFTLTEDLGGDLTIDGAGSNARVTGSTLITYANTTLDLTNRGTLTSNSVTVDNRARVTIDGLGSRLAAATTVAVDDARIVLQDRGRIESPVVRIGFEQAFTQSSFVGGHGTIVGSVDVGTANQFGSTIGVTERLEITGDLSADTGGGFDLPELWIGVDEKLVVGGAADLSNFVLRVDGDASMTPLYRRFILVDAGSISGQFADIVLPSVAAAQSAVEIAGGVAVGGAPAIALEHQTEGYQWVVTYTPNTVELQLIPAPGTVTIAPLLGLAMVRRRR